MNGGVARISPCELDILSSIISTTDVPSRVSAALRSSPRNSSALSVARLSAPRFSAAPRARLSRSFLDATANSGQSAGIDGRKSMPRLSEQPRSDGPRSSLGLGRRPRWSEPPRSYERGMPNFLEEPDRTTDIYDETIITATLTATEASRDGGSVEIAAAATREEEKDCLHGRALFGLYCSQMLLGLVNGFLLQNLVKPICLYVFEGVKNNPSGVTFAQCNIAPVVYQMPWNFKLLFAMFLDNKPLFGSRRYGWIVLGWGAALCCLLGIAMTVDEMVESNDFGTYNVLLMVMCACYMSAEVSADGLTIELSQYESEDDRGRLLTNGQIIRFGATGVAVLGTTLLLNGPAMYPTIPDHPGAASGLLSFGLNLQQLHWLVFFVALSLYVPMCCCLRDPPEREYWYEWKDAMIAFWETLQSKAMLYMIIFNVGFVTIAGLGNPAAIAVASIVVPTPMQLSLSAFVSKILFVVGAITFRRYFMARSWRVTCFWTHLLLLLEGLFYLCIIYDVGAIGQTGYFYCFGDCPMSVILGMSQVLSLLVSVEISKCGLEATTYELLTTIHNVALALNTNIGNMMIGFMKINTLHHDTYEDATAKELEDFNGILMNATALTMCIQLSGVVVFVWLLPADGIMCRVWRDDAAYHTRKVGAIGLSIASFLFFGTMALSILAVIPATQCARIVGGLGCKGSIF